MEFNLKKYKKIIKGIFIWSVALISLPGCSELRNERQLQISGCSASDCHISTVLKRSIPDTGKHTVHLAGGLDCDTCHAKYLDNRLHKNGTDDRYSGETIVFFNNVNPDASWNDSITSCENLYCHVNADWYGSATFGCTDCHYSGSAIDPVLINGSGTEGKHLKHVTERGISCGKCHSGYISTSTHVNGSLDTDNSSILITLFDSTNPSGSWTGDTGANTGSCASLICHGGSTLDWYGTGTWVLPACDTCHGAAVGTRRPVTGTGGDFAGNSSIVSNHVAGGTDPGEEQCKVCHEMSVHMGGTVRLREADADTAVIYDPSDNSTLEPFCLSCHDADGAAATFTTGGAADNPFNDGESLGAGLHVAGDKIEGYWSNTYTVHRDNGLTCAGSGEAGTGCHGNNGSINMHGSPSKGILTKNLSLPLPFDPPDPYDYNQYRLCFDCHESYPAVTKEVVLGYKQYGNYDLSWAPTPYYTSAIKTLFRDVYTGGTEAYDDTIWGDPFVPLHNYHLFSNDLAMDSKIIMRWAYRGDAGQPGRVTCVTCHNVHGTAGSVRSTYDDFGLVPGVNGTDAYTLLVNYLDTTLKSYPINCLKSCHDMSGQRYYWHTPANE